VPDPVFGPNHWIVRYILFCDVKSVPKGLPLDPNARIPNTRKHAYREIRDSLMNVGCEPGTFHLRHKGIALIASRVEGQDKTGIYRVTVEGGEGIVDRGHMYKLITEHSGSPLPDNQYVKFEILTKIPSDWIPEIAGAFFPLYVLHFLLWSGGDSNSRPLPCKEGPAPRRVSMSDG